MVVYPKEPAQAMVLAEFLREHAGVSRSDDQLALAWEQDGKLALVVGFNGFLGKVCNIHVAMPPNVHFTPRAMLTEVFNAAFNMLGREKLIGIVNSKNIRAMNYDLHLGFTEEYRIKGMHDDGGDIVVLGMTRDQCRYLEKSEAA